MATATLRTTPSKENIYFYICSLRLLVSELAHAKYVMSSFNSKKTYEKLAAIVRVLQNTQNLQSFYVVVVVVVREF